MDCRIVTWVMLLFLYIPGAVLNETIQPTPVFISSSIRVSETESYISSMFVDGRNSESVFTENLNLESNNLESTQIPVIEESSIFGPNEDTAQNYRSTVLLKEITENYESSIFSASAEILSSNIFEPSTLSSNIFEPSISSEITYQPDDLISSFDSSSLEEKISSPTFTSLEISSSIFEYSIESSKMSTPSNSDFSQRETSTINDVTPSSSIHPSPPSSSTLYYVTGKVFISMSATVNITEPIFESNDTSETQLDHQITGTISNNNTCTCEDDEKMRCPCDAILSVIAHHDVAPLTFYCSQTHEANNSKFRTSCNVSYADTESQERVPFTCMCDVEFRASFNPSKLQCSCNDVLTSTPAPTDPPSTTCECHEMQIYPDVFVRHNCTCSNPENNTFVVINDPAGTTANSCQQYEFNNGLIRVYVNCSRQNVDETTTVRPVFPHVNTSCPCKEIVLAGGEVIVLYNCTCRNPEVEEEVVEPTETSKNEVENCKCVEFELFDGQVKFRVNCTCEEKRECLCQGVHVDDNQLIVCLNCSKEVFEPVTTTTTTTTTVDPLLEQDSCISKCEKKELFDGQIVIHYNCSCHQNPRVFYYESSVFKAEELMTQCPCRSEMNERTKRMLNRRALDTVDTTPVLFCSCEMRERRQTMTSSIVSTLPSTNSTRPPAILSTFKSDASSTIEVVSSNESLVMGIPEKYWIRTVLKKPIMEIRDGKRLEMKLSKVYDAAFYKNFLIHLGLKSRTRRQIGRSNVSVSVLHVREYGGDSSLTEVIYAVKSGENLVPAKNAVQQVKLVEKDGKMEEILEIPVLLTEEYAKSETASASSNSGVIAVSILVPVLLIILLIFLYFYLKKKKLKTLNEQQVFQESGFVRGHSEMKSRMRAPLIEEQPSSLPSRRHREGGIRKKKTKEMLEARTHPEIIISSPSESGKSDDSLVRVKKTVKKKKGKKDSPLPLDVPRTVDRYQLPENVFDHVNTPPIKLPANKKKKLAPIRPRHLDIQQASSSGISSMGVSNLDVATISGSLNPIPAPRKLTASSKSKQKRVKDEDDDIEEMLRARAERVCPAEFLIQDIRTELERFHHSISSAK